MKNIINLGILSCLCLSSCKKDTVPIGVNIDIETNMHVVNEQGDNLLDTSIVGYYKKDSIRLYYLVNGEKKEVFNPSLDYPRNFLIGTNEDNKQKFIRLFVNEGTKDQEETITYVQWNASKTDTIKTLIARGSNVTEIKKLWYNSVLRFDDSKDPLDIYWGGQGIFRRFIEVTQ